MARLRRDVDPAWAGREAARMALDAQGATPLERGGEMELVLRPSAMAELVEFTVTPSVIGDAAQRGESAWTGRSGSRVAAAGLSIVDDPTLPGGMNSSRSDDEGVASRRNVLVDDGVLQGFLYDSFSAHEYKVGTTGSAVRGPEGGGWRAQPQAFPTNLVVTAPSRGEVDDLVAEVDRGLLVQEVMGAHTANVSTMDFSVGCTMPVEILRGERVGVRGPVMLAGNLGDVLGTVIGSGGAPRACPGAFSSACVVVPWLAAGGVVVTV
jgi:PmbA protein